MSEYLPPEVIRLILSRLPAKSVVKCTAVCKTWYALIKDPSFISTHLQQAAAEVQDDLLLVCFPDDELRAVYQLHRDNDSFEVCKQFPLPSMPDIDNGFIVGTCNGLICVAHVDDFVCNIILWNPTVQKHIILPDPDLPKDLPRESYYYPTLGFGFDSVSHDCKVLLLVPEGDTENVAEVWLFSLKRGSWTRLTEVSPKHGCYGLWKAVFVIGALHYGMFSHKILAFDISTEKFFDINVPEILVHFVCGMSLLQYEESIALVNRGNYDVKKCYS